MVAPNPWLIPYDRAQAFFWLQVVLLVTEIISPPAASVLMGLIGPQFTFLLSIPIESLGFLVILAMPSGEPAGNAQSPEANNHTRSPEDTAQHTLKDKLLHASAWLKGYIKEDMKRIIYQRTLLVGIIVLSISKIARPILELILQYMSARFDWPLSKVSFNLKPTTKIPTLERLTLDHIRLASYCHCKQQLRSCCSPSSCRLSSKGCVSCLIRQQRTSYLRGALCWYYP